MARGWESKDVESQRDLAADRESHRPADPVRQARELQLASLELSRRRVQADLAAATHPRRREQLELALRHLEEQIDKLEQP